MIWVLAGLALATVTAIGLLLWLACLTPVCCRRAVRRPGYLPDRAYRSKR